MVVKTRKNYRIELDPDGFLYVAPPYTQGDIVESATQSDIYKFLDLGFFATI